MISSLSCTFYVLMFFVFGITSACAFIHCNQHLEHNMNDATTTNDPHSDNSKQAICNNASFHQVSFYVDNTDPNNMGYLTNVSKHDPFHKFGTQTTVDNITVHTCDTLRDKLTFTPSF